MALSDADVQKQVRFVQKFTAKIPIYWEFLKLFKIDEIHVHRIFGRGHKIPLLSLVQHVM